VREPCEHRRGRERTGGPRGRTGTRRGDGHATPLTKIRLDEIAVDRLREQDLTPDSVPALGQRVVLRNNDESW
jgi:hypothetical protein